ncbi:uncharacterized protein PGTG_19068 [Puccinia graminis f. sp. tritici CRL 75-36-700-3]|uniref:Uncharacterized protein n=1 Tax=Puccinia graminis f. sp. tritici (strain CRL 75-36-700-3 / race SCCL) TaxID=418459 RepID=E3L9S5_PUCGT|nr:uncharacterized protein PGTG_19068 [Puccinia graminis f. sp. tritici CRL 75-36-700-3]EFP93300.2 hypothetical protein PGTG_19068 [Puccinia graminis f. sp. tritici CRL 75-36-700-3]
MYTPGADCCHCDGVFLPSQDRTLPASPHGLHTGSVEGLNDGCQETSAKGHLMPVKHACTPTLLAAIAQPVLSWYGNVLRQEGRHPEDKQTHIAQLTRVPFTSSNRLPIVPSGRLPRNFSYCQASGQMRHYIQARDNCHEHAFGAANSMFTKLDTLSGGAQFVNN